MKQEIYDFINGVVKSHHLVGIAIGIVRQSETYIEEGFGVRNQESGEIVTSDSLFHLASISKLFVATAMMQLVQQGKIALDDPLLHYLPYLKTKNPFGRQITIRHLLSHTSGIPDVTDYHWETPEDDDKALERYVRSLDIELMFKPGECFCYSNIAYEILGYLVAQVTNLPFEEFVKVNILTPLHMTTSTHFRKNVPPFLAVTPYVTNLTTQVADIYPYNRAHSPSSTLHSSAKEMNHWAIANLNQGYLFNTQILKSSTYSDMWKPQITVGNCNRPEKFAGLGWFIDQRSDLKYVYHSGQDTGFTTFILLVPEQSIGITVLCNSSPAPVEGIVFGILDILLGRKPAPLKPSVMLLLGEVYVEKGLDALKSCHAELLRNHSQEFDFSIGGFLNASSSLLDNNHNTEAIDILTFTLHLFPDNAAGHELLARAYFQCGDLKQALKNAQRSLEIEPNNPFLRGQIKPLLNQIK